MITVRLDETSGTAVRAWDYVDMDSGESIRYSHGAFINATLDGEIAFHLPEDCHEVLGPLIGNPKPFRAAVLQCAAERMTFEAISSLVVQTMAHGRSMFELGRRDKQKELRACLGV